MSNPTSPVSTSFLPENAKNETGFHSDTSGKFYLRSLWKLILTKYLRAAQISKISKISTSSPSWRGVILADEEMERRLYREDNKKTLNQMCQIVIFVWMYALYLKTRRRRKRKIICSNFANLIVSIFWSQSQNSSAQIFPPDLGPHPLKPGSNMEPQFFHCFSRVTLVSLLSSRFWSNLLCWQLWW